MDNRILTVDPNGNGKRGLPKLRDIFRRQRQDSDVSTVLKHNDTHNPWHCKHNMLTFKLLLKKPRLILNMGCILIFTVVWLNNQYK